MQKKRRPTQADIITFQSAVKGVKPLIHNKTRLIPTNKMPKKLKQQPITKEAFDLCASSDLPDVSGEAFISYKQTSLPNKILRKLHKGQYNVDAILDLHGLSVNEAKTAVGDFLQQCVDESIRVALIIHGKGLHSKMPILKNQLNHWLRETSLVLAFCSAAPGHGSGGAIYALLKRTTEEDSLLG